MTFLHPSYFAPVRGMRLAAFDHVFTPITLTRLRQPNGEYRNEWTEGDPIYGKLVIAGTNVAERAAALGVKAQWVGKLPLTATVIEGQRFRVEGSTADIPWTQTVEVTGDLKGDRINRRFTAVDVELVP